jgi:hypothetical protein
MKLSKIASFLIVGFLCGIAFIMSCGDQTSPTTVDAAAAQCDCPAAEPPLAGRIVRVTSDVVVPPMTLFGPSVFCPSGAILLSGGCFARSTDPKYVLNSSYPGPEGIPDPTAWACDFYNGTASPVTSTVYATCLKPAP